VQLPHDGRGRPLDSWCDGKPAWVERKAFEVRAWRVAFSHLYTAHTRKGLGLDDLELLARAAYLCGEDAAMEKAWIETNNDRSRRQIGREQLVVRSGWV
jgi:hypothetical protein